MSRYLLHLGDCLAGLRDLADNSVDHTLMDPPYDEETHTEGRRICSGTFAQRNSGGDTTVSKPISYPPMTEAERAEVSYHVARVTRRWITVNCQGDGSHLWRKALEAGGAEYVRTGSWQKTDAQPQLSGDRPGQGWEAIVICHGARAAGGAAAELPLLAGLDLQHSGRMRWNGGGHCATWRGPSRDHGGNLSRKKLVDGQKPEWLIDDLIAKFTDPGDLIADFYSGGGTTAVCSLRAGRRFIGWEKLPAHHAKALARIEASIAAGQMGLSL